MTYDRPARRRPPPSQMEPPTAAGISTGRALGLAIALTVSLLAAGTGVLAATGMLLPVSGRAAGAGPAGGSRTAGGSTAAARSGPAVAAQPGDPALGTPPPTAGVGQLTAFGATIRDWDANHRRDTAVAGGGAYNPDPAVGGDGRLADRYVRVLPQNGRIVQYTVQSPRNTPVTTASTRALTELPADARQIWREQRGTCTQAWYLSRTLARELTDVGDPKGAVLMEFRSGIVAGSGFDGGDVTSTTLSALDTPTPASAPLC